MNDWKIIVATVVIFGAGVISGGLLVNYADLSHLRVVAPAVPAPPNAIHASSTVTLSPSKNGSLSKFKQPEILSKQFLDRLDMELHLSAVQRADIETIIKSSQDQMRQVVQGVRQNARQQIRDDLDESQKRRFDSLFKLHRDGRRPGQGADAAVHAGAITNLPPATNSYPAGAQ